MSKRILIVDPEGTGSALADICRGVKLEPVFLTSADAHGASAELARIPDDALSTDAIVAAVREQRAAGVWATSDAAWTLAREAAERLNMPRIEHQEPDSALRERIARWQQAGLPLAPCHVCGDTASATAAARDLGYPVLLSRVDSLGNETRLLVTEEPELGLALKKLARDQGDSVLLHPVIPGESFRVIGFRQGRHFHPVEVIALRASAAHPELIAGMTVPSGLGGYDYTRVLDLARRAAQALPPAFGAVQVDVLKAETGLMLLALIETPKIDPSLAVLLKTALGIDLVGDAMLLAAGEQPRLVPSHELGAALVFLEPDTGQVQAVSGIESVQAMPGVTAVQLNVAPGNVIAHRNGAGTPAAGFVVAAGPTRDIARQRAEAATAALVIETVKALD